MKIWQTLPAEQQSNVDFSRTASSSGKTKFLSLKWSALILISLVFVIINAFFYSYNQKNLTQQFETSRKLNFKQNKAQLISLINQSRTHLLQYAELIPSLRDLTEAIEQDNAALLIQRFDAIWPRFAFQSQIESIGFVDANTQVINTWGEVNFREALKKPDLREKIAGSQHNAQPWFGILCFHYCKQYTVVPLPSRGKIWGSIIIASPLSEIFMNFSETTNMNIALLHEANEADVNTMNRLFYLPFWQQEIMLLSNFNQSKAILSEISRHTPLVKNGEIPTVTAIQDKYYETSVFTLKDSGHLHIAFIDDVTDEINNIQQLTKDMLLTGFFTLLFSELALLAILWRPLSKLRHASDIIPLLANNAFSATRQALAKQKPGKFIKNEIDILDENIIEVSHRLEKLQESVNQRTLSLADKMSELTRERDFIQNLLDTAQVIILTQNTRGEIQQINKYLVDISDYSEEELMSMNFLDLTQTENQQKLIKFNLKRILAGDQQHFKNESQLKCKSGELRTIEWLHSKIESKNAGRYEILSVGLDLTERKAYEEEISWLADHDPLTGLLNRRRFQTLLQGSLSAAKRYHHNVALLFLDLDNFKHINDTLGHQVGDTLIQAAASNLKLVLRETDSIARFGGDEFAIILPQIDAHGAIDVAEKINKCLGSMRVPMVDSNHRTMASIGIAIYPEHGDNEKELLSNADLAMYQAKSKGRGRWHLFSQSDDTRKRLENQIYWRNKINDALQDSGFELHFQPIISLKDHVTSHYEVLIRMRDQDGSIILPAPFIHIAEKTGLINGIDHFVLEHAIQEIQRQNKQGQHIKLAVNLSAHAFSDDKLFELLKQHLQISKIQPSQLIFEITETAALSDITAAVELINKIRSLGCLFALDDFGVGFSTFYYLKELPVDYVKIDGSFIQNLSSNRNDQILVKAITEIAQEFGKQIIAEFVEDSETLDLLKQYNVDYVQGFYVGTPERKVA